MKNIRQLFSIYLVIIFSIAALSEENINENPLSAHIRANLGEINQGANIEVVIDIDLDEPYHGYLDKFKLKVLSPEDFKISISEIKPIVEFKDVFSGEMKKGVEKKSKIHAVLEAPSHYPVGPTPIKIEVKYQACTTQHCLFPKTVSVESEATVISSIATNSAHKTQDAHDFKSAMDKGLFYAFLFVFLFGFLTSLTPCIYPMIPITLAVLGAKSEQSKWKGFSLSIAYVLGIAVTYAALGVAAAKTGALFGSALSNPYIVGAIAFVFVLMGLSMYGLFEVQAPAFIRQSIGTTKIQSGYIGAFLTGLVAGIVAGPCVGPVLVGILAYIAQTKDMFLGFWLLFVFAMGMGVLFIILGTFTSALNKIPKAGAWMEFTKFAFGSMMIGAALYVISPLASTRLMDVLMAVSLISVSSYYGVFRFSTNLSAMQAFAKGWLVAIFIAGLVFGARAIIGESLTTNENVKAEFKKLNWQSFSEDHLASALKSRKPIIIDFYADWCGACKELEKHTFTDERIQKLSEEFVLLKIDATEDFADLSKLKEKYEVLGLPTMIFYSPSGRWLKNQTLTGFEDADAFLNRMHATLNTKE